MTHVLVHRRTGDDSPAEPAGWFESSRAQKYESRVDGAGKTRRGMRPAPQMLYRTEEGAWVREIRLGRSIEAHREFVSEVVAHEWLVRNGHDDAADDLIDLPQEQGPGRPEIGGTVQVRLGWALLPDVDAFARREGCSRAEAMRRLVAAGLDADR